MYTSFCCRSKNDNSLCTCFQPASGMLPQAKGAKFYCRLCSYHLGDVGHCHKHMRDNRHVRLKRVSAAAVERRRLICFILLVCANIMGARFEAVLYADSLILITIYSVCSAVAAHGRPGVSLHPAADACAQRRGDARAAASLRRARPERRRLRAASGADRPTSSVHSAAGARWACVCVVHCVASV